MDQNSDVVEALVLEELGKGRIKGPFNTPPLDDFHVSPLKLVPKSTPGKFRLIHNLSFPYDETSVNFNIPKEESTVQYACVQDAIELIQKIGPGCFMAKSDIAQAFRIIPISEDCHHLLGFKFKGFYYYDTCLAMGASCSCKIFEEFSTALQWILKTKFKVDHCVHILDDFLFLAFSQKLAAHYLKCWTTLASDIGTPIAWDKTTDPAQIIIFAGVELNSLEMTACLPLDKLQRYTARVRELLGSRKATLETLQSVIGCLQWATSVVLPGKAFLRRLIDRTIGIKKPFHFATLNSEAQADLAMWEAFLRSHNGKSIFLPCSELTSATLHMFSDSSSKACAVVLGTDWFSIPFPVSWQDKNIAFLELYPITVAIHVFGDILRNSRVCFHTDNEAISIVINKQSAKNSDLMKLVRPLVLSCMNYNIKFRSKHIAGKLNVLADRLSRSLQVNPKLLQDFGMSPIPTHVPPALLPSNWRL